ncbi:hypothetical protein BCR39DRAFT_503160 [Naematelia encephala]|uniref:Uncharacterized protein n=1 Tax=Naematelia encephala TaxID=71784 RepID=A0A1Y2BIM5_9TREE|nr:hypothetical protein BCR39DRAFT_503160 [Naematelia encephala]
MSVSRLSIASRIPERIPWHGFSSSWSDPPSYESAITQNPSIDNEQTDQSMATDQFIDLASQFVDDFLDNALPLGVWQLTNLQKSVGTLSGLNEFVTKHRSEWTSGTTTKQQVMANLDTWYSSVRLSVLEARRNGEENTVPSEDQIAPIQSSLQERTRQGNDRERRESRFGHPRGCVCF